VSQIAEALRRSQEWQGIRWMRFVPCRAMEQDEHNLLKDRERRSGRAYQVAPNDGSADRSGLVMLGASSGAATQPLARQHAVAAINEQRAWLRVTLASIGDAVLATDITGRGYLPEARGRGVNGWTQAQADHQPLRRSFRIRHPRTSRQPLENPVVRVLRERTGGRAWQPYGLDRQGRGHAAYRRQRSSDL